MFGKVIISQPFFEYGGIIVKEEAEEVYKSILGFYKERIGKEGIKYIEIKTISDNNDGYFRRSGFVKQLKAFDFSIDIKDKDFEKDIWLKLFTAKSRVRNSVNKAIKNGVKIVEKDDIDLYYNLYLKTIEKLGSIPFPKLLFENIEKYLNPFVRFTFAYLGEKPVSALMSFCYNRRDLMVGLVSECSYQQYRANDLLYCQEIKYAIENKFDIIDIGRTQPNSSYERYKKKWGATKSNLYSYVYPPSKIRDIDPYRLYSLFSLITKRNLLWKIVTRTKIGKCLVRKFP